MIPVLSLVTSIKDYLEVVHKLIEYDSSNLNISYSELGTILTYLILSIKNGCLDFISFSWLKNIWSLPIIIPDISSAMISEISVLDGYFHNAFNFLDTPISYGEQNVYLLGLEKFSIGVLNSLFLCLPTSTAHIITLRRFVMQGLEAGFISGLGTIAGNLLWLTSVILGWRFIVIPWLSLDIFRYLLGFMLLVKYMWDSYNERRMVLEDLSKQKIFLLTFLLALTEQTSIYPFISNLSISPEASIFESFPVENSTQFIFIHLAYLLGIGVGSVSLLNLTCWFWENPAFKLYMWMISSFKVSTSLYYRALSSVFLYLTMISAISSIPYYGLDYTITNPLGYVNEDRLIQDKTVLETSFLGSKASDRNTRRNRGRHGRRERWKRRIRKYRTFDASLYDQGIYDLFTIEDLNYGFDRFWLRRKLRNHRVRFRFFPGPWMRSFKKQLAKPRLESYTGPRVEFFRILFEQVYHPSFHAYEKDSSSVKALKDNNSLGKNESLKGGYTSKGVSGSTKDSLTKFSYLSNLNIPEGQKEYSLYSLSPLVLGKGTIENNTSSGNTLTNNKEGYLIKNDWRSVNSTLRKFVRKLDSRLKTAQIVSSLKNMDEITTVGSFGGASASDKLYSKRWKHIFSKMSRGPEARAGRILVNPSFSYNKEKVLPKEQNILTPSLVGGAGSQGDLPLGVPDFGKKSNVRKILSKKDLQILRYRSLINVSDEFSSQSFRTNALVNTANGNGKLNEDNLLPSGAVLLHPLKFYLQKQKGFERKLRYYTPSVFRKFSVENNAPYFRVMMRRYFYNYKATNRWERTMKDASLRKARRKTTRIPRKLPSGGNFENGSAGFVNLNNSQQNIVSTPSNILNNDTVTILNNRLIKPTNNYSVVSKRASRYRYQIYKDVLQHWYYSPFNRMLMKFDVDSFIRRQPNSHFLTPKEENLLHLRRFLLSEHYNTLRWYTNMEHYRSMKTRINGTKSFSSQVYNQQFSGTFKKIRHLFAITPSQGNVVLKFDQPLYNEYPNQKSNPLLNPLILHEELLGPSDTSNEYSKDLNDDLISQSQKLVRDYLIQTRGAREDYIKELLNQNNYTTLTQFLYKGGKIRGDSPVTNQRLLNNQEKDMLFTTNEKRAMDEQFNKEKIRNFINNKSFMEDLYLSYLFKWKRRVNDQEFLKNYLTRRIDKREKRKQRKEKNLYAKLKRLQTLDELGSVGKKPANDSLLNQQSVGNEYLTSGLQKSILEGMYTLNNVDSLGKTGSSYEKSLWKVLLLSKIKKMNGVGNVLDPSEQKQTFLDLKVAQQRLISKEIRISASQLTSVLEKFKKDRISNRNLFNYYKNPTKTGIIKKLSLRINRVYKMFKTNIPSYLGLTKIQNLLKPIKRKSLQNWRKKERALSKQRLRKDFKLLNKKTELSPLNETLSNLDRNEMNNALVSASSRKKRSFNTTSSKEDLSFNKILNTADPNGSQVLSETGDLPKGFSEIAAQSSGSSRFGNVVFNFLGRDFKRKRSPQRRSRTRRNRGVFKKRTLNDTLKKDIKTFKNTETLTTDVKKSFYEKMNMLLYQPAQSESLETSFQAQGLKQRKSKQRKQRYWKQKRSKYSQKRRKYRKRRRYALGKIRVLSKVLKRVKNKHEIQNWWWKKYMPSVQASTDALWQIEKDMFIQQKLSEFSTAEILERDRMNNSSLQIGSKDFKPLAIPQNIRLQSVNKDPLSFDVSNTASVNTNDLSSLTSKNIRSESDRSNFQTVNKLYENLFINKNGSGSTYGNNSLSNDFMSPNTMLPFYAGWDESLRKFIVTNRMLSRLDAGYEVKQLDNTTTVPALKPLTDRLSENTPTPGVGLNNSVIEFTNAPLQGMNAATTLYWQIPFTTYDPDQFFALGMDGFSPIGWRKFVFRHSILKSWLNTINTQKSLSSLQTSKVGDNDSSSGTLIVKVKQDIQNINGDRNSSNSVKQLSSGLTVANTGALSTMLNLATQKNEKFKSYSFGKEHGVDAKNISRRLKKRYRRVKKHPRTPVWFPSGPLLNQVLPVHYIYVFYKRSRLPRDRYLKRRLLTKQKIMESEGFQKAFASNPAASFYDFTLRKRLKPKRKYHLKRDFYSKNLVIPRRFKFISSVDSSREIYNSWGNRMRPLSSKKINKPIADLVKEQKLMRTKQRRKELSSNQQTPMLRVKQLRRRVQRQILRSVWRYRPRAGGFVWPGDYLKLESVKAPKLKEKTLSTNNSSEKASFGGRLSLRKTKRKKKRNLVEWQIQPKKYLYQKHNLKVLKKKLEKAQRSDKIQQKIKEFSYKF